MSATQGNGQGIRFTGQFNSLVSTEKTSKQGKPYVQHLVYANAVLRNGRRPEICIQTFNPEFFKDLKCGDTFSVPIVAESSQGSDRVFYKHFGEKVNL